MFNEFFRRLGGQKDYDENFLEWFRGPVGHRIHVLLENGYER